MKRLLILMVVVIILQLNFTASSECEDSYYICYPDENPSKEYEDSYYICYPSESPLDRGLIWMGDDVTNGEVDEFIIRSLTLDPIFGYINVETNSDYLHIYSDNDVCIHQQTKVGDMMEDRNDENENVGGILEVQKIYENRPINNHTCHMNATINSSICNITVRDLLDQEPKNFRNALYTIGSSNLGFYYSLPPSQSQLSDEEGPRSVYGANNCAFASSDNYYDLDGMETTPVTKLGDCTKPPHITELVGGSYVASTFGRLTDPDGSPGIIDTKFNTFQESQEVYVSPAIMHGTYGAKNVPCFDTLALYDNTGTTVTYKGHIGTAIGSYNAAAAVCKGSLMNVDHAIGGIFNFIVADVLEAPVNADKDPPDYKSWCQRDNEDLYKIGDKQKPVDIYTGIAVRGPTSCNILENPDVYGQKYVGQNNGIFVQDFARGNNPNSPSSPQNGEDGLSILTYGSVQLGDGDGTGIGTDITTVKDIMRLYPREDHPSDVTEDMGGIIWAKKDASDNAEIFFYDGNSNKTFYKIDIETTSTATTTPTPTPTPSFTPTPPPTSTPTPTLPPTPTPSFTPTPTPTSMPTPTPYGGMIWAGDDTDEVDSFMIGSQSPYPYDLFEGSSHVTLEGDNGSSSTYMHFYSDNDIGFLHKLKIGAVMPYRDAEGFDDNVNYYDTMMSDSNDSKNICGQLEVQSINNEEPLTNGEVCHMSGSVYSSICDVPASVLTSQEVKSFRNALYTIGTSNYGIYHSIPPTTEELPSGEGPRSAYGAVFNAFIPADLYYDLDDNKTSPICKLGFEPKLTQVIGAENLSLPHSKLLGENGIIDTKNNTFQEDHDCYVSPCHVGTIFGSKNVACFDTLAVYDSSCSQLKYKGKVGCAIGSYNAIAAMCKGSLINTDYAAAGIFILFIENPLNAPVNLDEPTTSTNYKSWCQRDNEDLWGRDPQTDELIPPIKKYTGIVVIGPTNNEQQYIGQSNGIFVQDFGRGNNSSSPGGPVNGEDGLSILSYGSVQFGDSDALATGIGTDITTVNDILLITLRDNHPSRNHVTTDMGGLIWAKKNGSSADLYFYDGNTEKKPYKISMTLEGTLP